MSGSGTLQVIKQVQNLSTGGAYGTTGTALPAQTLQYHVTIVNQGRTPLSQVIIDDSTPAFTMFVAAACAAAASLPAGLTQCSITAHPAPASTGALQWSYAGSLAPGA